PAQVLPRSGNPLDVRLAAQLAFGTDVAGDAGDLGREGRELVDHRVDRVFQLQDLAAHVDRDFLGEVAVGHGLGDVGDIAHLSGQVARHEIDVVGQVQLGSG